MRAVGGDLEQPRRYRTSQLNGTQSGENRRPVRQPTHRKPRYGLPESDFCTAV
jgi:hypothetical protein